MFCRVRFVKRTLLAAVVISVSVGSLAAAPNDKPQQDDSFPPFSVFSAAVQQYFDKQPKYRDGDIISQSDAKAVFRILKQGGWDVTNRAEILKEVLPDSDYMVVQLRTKAGRKFMHQLSRTPEAYDRLERFLKLPKSRRFFRGLLKGPDGYKLFEYMVTAKGGKVLGQQLSHTKAGRDFNKPTGHIYTAKQFTERLSESHADYLAGLQQPEPPPEPAGN